MPYVLLTPVAPGSAVGIALELMTLCRCPASSFRPNGALVIASLTAADADTSDLVQANTPRLLQQNSPIQFGANIRRYFDIARKPLPDAWVQQYLRNLVAAATHLDAATMSSDEDPSWKMESSNKVSG